MKVTLLCACAIFFVFGPFILTIAAGFPFPILSDVFPFLFRRIPRPPPPPSPLPPENGPWRWNVGVGRSSADDGPPHSALAVPVADLYGLPSPSLDHMNELNATQPDGHHADKRTFEYLQKTQEYLKGLKAAHDKLKLRKVHLRVSFGPIVIPDESGDGWKEEMPTGAPPGTTDTPFIDDGEDGIVPPSSTTTAAPPDESEEDVEPGREVEETTPHVPRPSTPSTSTLRPTRRIATTRRSMTRGGSPDSIETEEEILPGGQEPRTPTSTTTTTAAPALPSLTDYKNAVLESIKAKIKANLAFPSFSELGGSLLPAVLTNVLKSKKPTTISGKVTKQVALAGLAGAEAVAKAKAKAREKEKQKQKSRVQRSSKERDSRERETNRVMFYHTSPDVDVPPRPPRQWRWPPPEDGSYEAETGNSRVFTVKPKLRPPRATRRSTTTTTPTSTTPTPPPSRWARPRTRGRPFTKIPELLDLEPEVLYKHPSPKPKKFRSTAMSTTSTTPRPSIWTLWSTSPPSTPKPKRKPFSTTTTTPPPPGPRLPRMPKGEFDDYDGSFTTKAKGKGKSQSRITNKKPNAIYGPPRPPYGLLEPPDEGEEEVLPGGFTTRRTTTTTRRPLIGATMAVVVV